MHDVGGELTEIRRAECLRLLTREQIGRVAFTAHALPAVHPVAYVLDGEEIVFRTAAGSTLAAAVRHAVVGFQVDDVDPATRTGWSVLGVGEAYEVVVPDRLAELAAVLPDPWVAGRDGHVISIPLQVLHGHRLHPAAPELDAEPSCA
ncbi:pyridoxamine 5'-phosphate oxidase family protein [Pseudonocardia yuanmonensis]|uniref:Pyridoxamine 5'-phosphate oxidase family protein n=1 Tax=Pseudonocardia yuanmonensis TaxID=1095914 RepID=A0ABP8XWV0_9PSEU